MVEANRIENSVGGSALEIDQNLRRIASRRAGLDAELGRWLRRADEQRIWNSLGYVHALEYLEDVFGFSPRSARERLRVANELSQLQAFERALESGILSYGVVRELTRVATAETESQWLAVARGKNLRQVERLVAGHEKGDAPDDDVNPDLFDCAVTWKLRASVGALLREARKHLNDETGLNLDDGQFVEMLCRRALEGGDDKSGPARMIHVGTCRHCKSATQVGAGRRVPISATDFELASCDAVIVDDEHGERRTQTIPAGCRREVMERDNHACRVPGCRASRNLDVHHLTRRGLGGGHELWNLLVLCSGHHGLHHDGMLVISGRADGDLTFTRVGRALADDKATHVFARHTLEPSTRAPTTSAPTTSATPEQEERDTLATSALRQSGYKASVAADAVRRAAGVVAADADLPTLLRQALRFCE